MIVEFQGQFFKVVREGCPIYDDVTSCPNRPHSAAVMHATLLDLTETLLDPEVLKLRGKVCLNMKMVKVVDMRTQREEVEAAVRSSEAAQQLVDEVWRKPQQPRFTPKTLNDTYERIIKKNTDIYREQKFLDAYAKPYIVKKRMWGSGI